MDIIEQFKDVKKIWSERKLFGKIVLSVAFIWWMVSLGSIANQVYEFKGFIVRALDMYMLLTRPVIEFLAGILPWKLTRTWFDTFTIFAIHWGLFVQALKYVPSPEKTRHYLYNVLAAVLVFAVGYLIASVILTAEGDLKAWGAIGLIAMVVIIFGVRDMTVNENFKIARVTKAIWTAWAALLVGFCIICAISEGLTRPLGN